MLDNINYKEILLILAGKKKIKHSIYDKVAIQLQYGINLKESINSLSKRAEKNKNIVLSYVLNDIKANIANGETFAKSIRKWIPESDYAIIVSSERAGKISDALNLIITLDNMKSELLSEFISGLIGPSILFLSVYGLLYYMGKYALGSILKLITTKITGPATLLISLSNFTNSIWIFIFPIILFLIIGLIFYSFPRFSGKIRKELDIIFPYSIYRRYSGAVWLIGFSGLITSGITEVNALKEMLKYSNNYLKERLRSFVIGMQNGMNIGEAMQISNFNFPDSEVVDDIAVFSNFPNFSEKLKLIAQQNINSTKKSIKIISSLVQAIINIMLYAVIIFIVVAVFSLTSNMTNSMHI